MINPPALPVLPGNASGRPARTDRRPLRAVEVTDAADIDVDDFVVDWQLDLVTGPAR
jgi:hypothetical protein